MKFQFIYFLLLSFLTFSCNDKVQSKAETIEAKDFFNKIENSKNPQIIDARTKQEYSIEHIDKAINIDCESENFRSDLEILDKTKPIFIYFKNDSINKIATNKLQKIAFKNIYILNGGFVKWKSSGYSKPTKKIGGMSKQDYEKLLNSDKTVLINFSEKSCDPCEKMAPYLVKLQKEFSKKLIIINIDAEENKTLLTEMKIEILPSFFLYKNSNLKWKHFGFINEDDLKKQLQSFINKEYKKNTN